MVNDKKFTIKEYDNYQYVAFNDGRPMIVLRMEAFGTYAAFHKIIDLLNVYDDNLQMCREKALYWQNKAENIFGDMQTNVELKKENIKLRQKLKEKDNKMLDKKITSNGNNSKYNDGRCCNICGNLETKYYDWDCSGTWTSESRCCAGHDLNETDGTQCEDYYYGV